MTEDRRFPQRQHEAKHHPVPAKGRLSAAGTRRMRTARTTVETLVNRLSHPLSAKRRAAAKQLRRLGDASAGPALRDALRLEVQDPRTWETQYQMIMALGECKCEGVTSLLREFAATKLEYMTHVAVGDALVRLSHDPEKEGSRRESCGKEKRRILPVVLRNWKKSCPGVVASFEEGGDELLTFFAFPAAPWKCLHTTNAIERLNEEFRRRVKTQGSFPSEDAAVVLLYSLVASGQIELRKIDGHELVRATMTKNVALAAAA